MPKLTNVGVVGFAALALYGSVAVADEVSGEAAEAISSEQSTVESRSVFDGSGFSDRSALRETGTIGLSDLSTDNSKGVFIQRNEFNATALDLSIRGIGGTTVNQVTGESGVGVYVDGVFLPRGMGLGLDVVDIESMQINRGSQGVLSGRNSSGGSVHLTTVKPSGEFSVEQQLGFGFEFGEVQSITHVDLPKIGVVSARVSYLINEHDGWVENDLGVVSEDNFFHLKDNDGLRVALRLNLSENSTIDYAYERSESFTTHDYFVVSSNGLGGSGLSATSERPDKSTTAISIPQTEVDVRSHTVIAAWDLDDGTQVKFTTSLRDVDSKEFTNFGDSAEFPGLALGGTLLGVNVAATTPGIPDRQSQNQISQAVDITASLFDGLVDFMGGASYFNEDVTLNGFNARGDSDTEVVSVYGRGTINFTDALSLALGLRATREDKLIESFVRDGVVTNETAVIEDETTDYSIKFAYNAGGHELYASFATGYKSGGASLLSNSLRPYLAETSETTELGYGANLLDDRISYSLVGFLTRIEDRQLVFSDPNHIRYTDVLNADDDTTLTGLEVAAAYRIIDNLTFSFAYNYLDVDVDDIRYPYANNIGGFEFTPGAGPVITPHIERAPRHSGNVAVTYEIGEFDAGDMALRVEYAGIGKHYLDAFSDQQASRDLVNARLTLAGFELEGDSGVIDVVIWGNNLLDKQYADNRISINDGNPANTYTISSFGEPRAYGVDVIFEL